MQLLVQGSPGTSFTKRWPAWPMTIRARICPLAFIGPTAASQVADFMWAPGINKQRNRKPYLFRPAFRRCYVCYFCYLAIAWRDDQK
jgi:hypothetical protein